MKLLPAIDPATPVVNSVLGPYFNDLAKDLRSMTEEQRNAHLPLYKKYIEEQAQKASSKALRLQLRINLMALLKEFHPEPTFEITVFPKKKRNRIFDGETCREAFEEELLPTII